MRNQRSKTLCITLVLVLLGFMPSPTNAGSRINVFAFLKDFFQPNQLHAQNLETTGNHSLPEGNGDLNSTATEIVGRTAIATESRNDGKARTIENATSLNERQPSLESSMDDTYHAMDKSKNQTENKPKQIRRPVPPVLDVRSALLSPSSSSLGETCTNVGLGCDGGLFLREDDVMIVFNSKGGQALFHYPNLLSNDPSEWSVAILNGQVAYQSGIIPAMPAPRRQPSSPVMELPPELKHLHESILWRSDFCIFQSTYVERDPYQSLAPPSDLRQIGCTRSPTLSFL